MDSRSHCGIWPENAIDQQDLGKSAAFARLICPSNKPWDSDDEAGRDESVTAGDASDVRESDRLPIVIPLRIRQHPRANLWCA